MSPGAFVKIPYDNPANLESFSQPERDISDFTISSDERLVAFDSLSNPETKGTFYYDIFLFDRDKQEELQLTEHKKRAFNPAFLQDNSKVYYIVENS
ncbi:MULTISPECIES: hypothetical protein [Bacillus]|uniref:hypothetical protein n=1 Tax=Bacillus TaxID=1386 RepID=UPI0002E74A92|nr:MULTISPECIES: hypothetical protein [Bacillus]